MARKTLTAVIAVIATFAILSAMLAGCGTKTPEERFEEGRSDSSVVTTDGAKILQEKTISLLKENDIEVLNSYVSARFLDGEPLITFVAMVTEKDGGKPTLKCYSVRTDFNGPIASAFGYCSNYISVHGDMLYIREYFEYANYDLQGEDIIVTE